MLKKDKNLLSTAQSRHPLISINPFSLLYNCVACTFYLRALLTLHALATSEKKRTWYLFHIADNRESVIFCILFLMLLRKENKGKNSQRKTRSCEIGDCKDKERQKVNFIHCIIARIALLKQTLKHLWEVFFGTKRLFQLFLVSLQ